MTVNIYRLNEYDWVAAESMEQACEFYIGFTGDPETIDDPGQLTPEELATLKFTIGADEPVYGLPAGLYSFQVVLAAALAAGEQAPFLFASTES